MATTVITQVTDDLDGTPDAQAYRLIDPSNGKTLTIDLSTKNYERLAKALAPFIEKARPVPQSGGGATGAGKGTQSRSSGRSKPDETKTHTFADGSTIEYTDAELRTWATETDFSIPRGRRNDATMGPFREWRSK